MAAQLTLAPGSLVFCDPIASGARGLLRKLQLYFRRLSGMMVDVDSLTVRAAGEASAVRQTTVTPGEWL
jgi:hypothetical protein